MYVTTYVYKLVKHHASTIDVGKTNWVACSSSRFCASLVSVTTSTWCFYTIRIFEVDRLSVKSHDTNTFVCSTEYIILPHSYVPVMCNGAHRWVYVTNVKRNFYAKRRVVTVYLLHGSCHISVKVTRHTGDGLLLNNILNLPDILLWSLIVEVIRFRRVARWRIFRDCLRLTRVDATWRNVTDVTRCDTTCREHVSRRSRERPLTWIYRSQIKVLAEHPEPITTAITIYNKSSLPHLVCRLSYLRCSVTPSHFIISFNLIRGRY